MELFKSMAGIDLVHVPYKGSAPAMTALVGGEIGSAAARDIASAAGVTVGALFHHFGSKEQLLIALLEDCEAKETAEHLTRTHGVQVHTVRADLTTLADVDHYRVVAPAVGHGVGQGDRLGAQDGERRDRGGLRQPLRSGAAGRVSRRRNSVYAAGNDPRICP